MSQTALFFLSFSIIFALSIDGQNDSIHDLPHTSSPDYSLLRLDTTDGTCVPQIVIFNQSVSKTICLNHLAPSDDSCAEVLIGFHGTKVRFRCNKEHLWSYSGISTVEKIEQHSVKVNHIVMEDNKLVKATISLTNSTDSSRTIKLDLNYAYDLPYKQDTVEKLNYSIERLVYFCSDQPAPDTAKVLKYTYLTNYGKREPVYNYPELSMFQCGGTVRMPTSGSLYETADLMLNYHILHPDKLKFSESDILFEEKFLSKQRKIIAYEDSLAQVRKIKRSKRKFSLKPL